jgi:hypothetical protein
VTPSDDDRIAYLAGEPGEPLDAQTRAEFDALRELLGAPGTWAEPDTDLENRIVAAIVAEARTRRAAAPAVSPAPDRAPRSRWWPPVRRPAFALAAAAVAAAVIVIAISSGSSSPKPLHFAMVVTGTALAPDAHGSASLTKTGSGWRIRLQATGLPHLEGSHFYQAWLKNAAGVLVPVGTFNDARNITLWSGVPVTKFRTLTVTIQPANGDPTSSGRRVMIGTISGSG